MIFVPVGDMILWRNFYYITVKKNSCIILQLNSLVGILISVLISRFDLCQVIIIVVGLELKFAIRYFNALVEHGNIQNIKKTHLILHRFF